MDSNAPKYLPGQDPFTKTLHVKLPRAVGWGTMAGITDTVLAGYVADALYARGFMADSPTGLRFRALGFVILGTAVAFALAWLGLLPGTHRAKQVPRSRADFWGLLCAFLVAAFGVLMLCG